MFTAHWGETISLVVAFCWTITAVAFEYSGRRIGSLNVNILRLVFAFFLLGGLLFYLNGSFFPVGADARTWFWLSLSGVVGFVLGDLCLFRSYLLISSRFSQLIMTLAPPIAAITGFFMLKERMGLLAVIGMCITLFGIGLSVLSRSDDEDEKKGKIKLKLPLKGVLLALGGAIGQGVGIVLSKKGMDCYSLSAGDTVSAGYIPFAATQIRVIVGVIGFVFIILLWKCGKAAIHSLSDKKGVGVVFLGAIFGPFIGVSLSLLAVQYTETGIASTIMALVPVLIIIPSALIFKDKITLREVIGAIVSVAGVSLFFIG